MAFKRLFDDKFITDKQQRTNYHKWSERAIIVGYNGDTQTYDVVITTERLAGVSKRTLNKTIRNVKATIPPSSLTFSPGDSVLVGYVSEKREHPVIIGGGGNVVQDAAVVTIGSSTSEVEGGSPELTGEEGFSEPSEPILFGLVDSVTGSTQSYTVDCDDIAGDGFFTSELIIQAGFAPFTVAVTNFPVGCTVTSEVVGTRVRLKQPNSVGTTALAFIKSAYEVPCAGIFPACGTDPGNDGLVIGTHETNFHRVAYNCNGDLMSLSPSDPCDFRSITLPFTKTMIFNEFSCTGEITCESLRDKNGLSSDPEDPNSGPLQRRFAVTGGVTNPDEVPSGFSCVVFSCVNKQNFDLSTDPCKFARDFGVPRDERSAAQIAAQCCPCTQLGTILVTVTDSVGDIATVDAVIKIT